MKKLILFFVLLAVFIVGYASAEQYKFGPYPNYEGLETFSGVVIIPTTTEIDLGVTSLPLCCFVPF